MPRVSAQHLIFESLPLTSMCYSVGISGHALHGGYGMASRMWGTTLDTITEMEVVLADGTITTASKTKNLDLFWVNLQHSFSSI